MSAARRGQDAPLAAGVEVTDRATHLTLVLGETSQARRWHTRLAAPPTPHQAVDEVAELLERALRDVGDEHAPPTQRPVAIGVALEDAKVDPHSGIVRRLRLAPGWEDVPLADLLGKSIGASVHLATNTNAAAVAEARIGAGLGLDPLLYVSINRTITASLVVGGRYYASTRGEAGQLGHVLVRPGGPRCPCGAYGHLDPIASAQSLARNLIGRAADSDESTAAMLRASGGRAEAISVLQVVQLAQKGDPAARVVLDEALDALAVALANQIAMLAPAAIVIGGPLAAASDGFFAPLAARLAALRGPAANLLELRPAALGSVAALLGARLLATGGGMLP